MFDFMMKIDQNVLLWIQTNVRNELLTPFFIFITTLGNNGMVWILMSLALLISKKTRRIGMLSLIALGGSYLICNVAIKNVVARIRPYDTIPDLQRLIGIQKDYSFPSGHTSSSFSSAVVLLLGLPKKYGFPAVLLAVLIGFSRLYVGVHYLSDVLCGAAIGACIAYFVYKLGMIQIGKKRNFNR